ncbi:uncharacterized protein LTR77_001198 [Saxophila tyrrhenica]|uniref:Uncharacterized protein n=1 Tax=Saxophila tyrrhenica TaxID=1690608 RepID=A0AAV9PJU2_9PEZI|nr:hypothetical protein LTR77_001198 [Saxophila tyrrhenica]
MGPIRALAVLPAVLCMVSLILSFLCLFAGSKKNFMEDYAIITLNTSQIGQDLPIFDDINDSLFERDVTAAADVASPVITAAPDATPAPDLFRRSESQNWAESVWSKGTADVASVYTKATGAIPIPTKAVAAVDWLKEEGHEISEELVEEAESLTNRFENMIEEGLGDFAQVLGLHDFYSAHILNFCEGFYVPASAPNATLGSGSIHKNVTHCSRKTAMKTFDPEKTISRELNESTNGFIDISDVEWPDDIRDGINALKVAQKAMFVLYCLAIGFIFLAMVTAMMGIFFNGRLSAFINVAVDSLAFMLITVASAIVTFVADKASHFINEHGDEIGISATRGNKFLALTWASTGLVFVAMLVWVYLLFTSVKGGMRKRKEMEQKYG